ncbi:unnamed protein product [Paramecium sonneborni]|uniref:Uncharacterized protein n=1 Tax=Paramecium sonneborni TaxID=65129 RepID=A0A8S1Q435_9CILI|nr:unnamed protein product [Paramecium sonneborni]
MGQNKAFGQYILKIILLVVESILRMVVREEDGLNYMIILIGFILYFTIQFKQYQSYNNWQLLRQSKKWKMEFFSWIKNYVLKNYDFQRGGGFYDEDGYKHGQWVELDEDFNQSLVDPCKLTFFGEYDRGVKKGKFIQNEID